MADKTTARKKPAAKKKPAVRKKPASALPPNHKTPFVPGNQLWMLRKTTPGPPRKYENADELWQKCLEYFQWFHDNPLMAAETVKFQGKSELTAIPKMRAMTIASLCFYLEINDVTWREWRTSRPDLSMIIRATEHVIYAQKLEGAAADLLNANIISRELGLTDKSEIGGVDGAPIQIEDKSDKDPMELARAVIFMLNKSLHEAAEAKKQGGDEAGE